MPQHSIINILARKESKTFAIQPNEGLNSPLKSLSFMNTLQEINLNTTPLRTRSPSKYNEERVEDAEGRSYVALMKTSNGTVFINESPEKQKPETPKHHPSGEVRFENFPSIAELKKTHPDIFSTLEQQKFTFTVTKEMIKQRCGVKRSRTQIQVCGRSAKSIFKESCVILEKNMNQIFHLAHRQAHTLNGSQTKDNLDPGTAGSNYSTLFRIESPIKQLLAEEKNVSQLTVNGTVIFHPFVHLPIEITYQLSWGNGRTAEACIHPLEYRSPTMDEHIVTSATLKAIRTPEKLSNANERPLFFSKDRAQNSLDDEVSNKKLMF